MPKLTKKEQAELAYFVSYSQDRLVWHYNLVVPLALLYNDHMQWAKEEFTKPIPKERFVDLLLGSGAFITRGGSGRLRHAAHCVGLRPVNKG